MNDLLIEKFEQLYEMDNNWAQTVREEQEKNTAPENRDLINAFNELFSAAREAYKQDGERTEGIFREYMSENDLWLLKDVKSSLEIFFDISELREIQNTDEEKAKRIIQYLFNNAVVYFDRQFVNSYDEFGFQSLDSFYNTARILDGLTEYYVLRHMSAEAIIRDLKSETGFRESICKYCADKIRENYQILQMNILMDMMRVDNEKQGE